MMDDVRRRAEEDTRGPVTIEAVRDSIAYFVSKGWVECHPDDVDKPESEKRWRLTPKGLVEGPPQREQPHVLDGQHRA